MNPTDLFTLKSLWQSTLTEPEKSFWRQQFLNPIATTEDLRHLIREKQIGRAHV